MANYIGTNNATLSSITASNTSQQFLAENGGRVQLYLSAVGGAAFVQLIDEADNTRMGIYLAENTQFPLHFTSNVVYYGKIFVINAVADESPVIHATELTR